jgi:hypothetical protein
MLIGPVGELMEGIDDFAILLSDVCELIDIVGAVNFGNSIGY